MYIVIIYSPSCRSKHVWVYFFFWTHNIFWFVCVTKELTVAIDFQSIFSPYNGSQLLLSTFWLHTWIKIYYFVLNSCNKCRFGTTWGWVNDARIFIFGWTFPLSLPLRDNSSSDNLFIHISRMTSFQVTTVSHSLVIIHFSVKEMQWKWMVCDACQPITFCIVFHGGKKVIRACHNMRRVFGRYPLNSSPSSGH